MAKQAMASKFFTTKRTKGGVMLLIRGKQVASVYRDGSKFWGVCCDTNKTEYDFETFAAADNWAWLNYA